MKNILVATDFSESSKNATNYAVQLALRAKLEITLFHVSTIQVIDPVAPAFYLDTLIQEKEKDSMQLLEELKSRMHQVLHSDSEKLRITTKSAIGMPAIEIARAANEQSIGLILTGGKKGDFWARLTGSTVVDLLGNAKKPLLVVPEKAQFKKMDSIVVATNLEAGDEGFVKQVIDFAKIFDAHVLIMHVNEDANQQVEERFEKLKQNITDELKYDKVSFEIVRLEVSSQTIDLISELDNADLVALRKIERSFISELFHKSMTKEKIYHTEVPLLIYH
jgi:nucleotide-binding universal stress UspA family protein